MRTWWTQECWIRFRGYKFVMQKVRSRQDAQVCMIVKLLVSGYSEVVLIMFSVGILTALVAFSINITIVVLAKVKYTSTACSGSGLTTVWKVSVRMSVHLSLHTL